MDCEIGERPVRTIKKRIGKVEVDIWYGDEKTINSSYPPILMIHGMFGGGWYFENWAKFLYDKGFIVYIVNDLHKDEDLRKVDFYTYLDKVLKVVDFIGMMDDKMILLGHSMGGLIVQKIAETKPNLVAGLVLIASAPPKNIPTMSRDVIKAMAKHWFSLAFNLPLKIDRESVFNLLFNWLGGDGEKEQFFQKLVPESSKVAMQLAFSRIPVDEKKVVCKILVVAGLYDRLLSYKTQIRIANKYDADYNSHLTGHMPMLDRQSCGVIENIYQWIASCFGYK